MSEHDARERFGLYRLCECPTCSSSGKAFIWKRDKPRPRCEQCRGEGRIRQEVASCETPEAVGVALVTLAREGEFTDCPFGLLDREGETGHKWLILPWLPSARNVRDAARTLARSKRKPSSDRDIVTDEGAYEMNDPKHPDYHSIHADLWDAREGK